MNRTIIHYREDLDLQNILDYSQKKFGCCGAVSYNDWSMNKYFNCSDNPSQERCGVPYSCCLISKNEGVVNTMCGYGMQERDKEAAEKHIHTTGCLDKFIDWMRNNQFLLGAIALGFAVSQLIGIYLSCTLVNQIKLQSNCGAGFYY
ncbi:tetraspanin-33-like [Engraulis encrasicolus]|uniref:tetraspanin-33-like n=1 Tax=Engraulis encrasicolus TaxID=184585 RepID=UPI002FD72540